MFLDCGIGFRSVCLCLNLLNCTLLKCVRKNSVTLILKRKQNQNQKSKVQGLPWWSSGKVCTAPLQRHGFDPLVDQLVKNPPAMQKTPALFDSWVGNFPWRRDRLPTPAFMGFPDGSDGEESTCNAGELGSIPGLGRSPGGGHGNPIQYSCLANPHGQRTQLSIALCQERPRMP